MKFMCSSLPKPFLLRVARLQNEIAPEKCLIWYEKGLEKREKDSKNDPKRVRKVLALSCLFKIPSVPKLLHYSTIFLDN